MVFNYFLSGISIVELMWTIRPTPAIFQTKNAHQLLNDIVKSALDEKDFVELSDVDQSVGKQLGKLNIFSYETGEYLISAATCHDFFQCHLLQL